MSRTLKERWEGLKAKFCEEELAFIEENSSLSREGHVRGVQHRFRRADVSPVPLSLSDSTMDGCGTELVLRDS